MTPPARGRAVVRAYAHNQVRICFPAADLPHLPQGRFDLAWNQRSGRVRLTPSPDGQYGWDAYYGGGAKTCFSAASLARQLAAEGITLAGTYPYVVQRGVVYLHITPPHKIPLTEAQLTAIAWADPALSTPELARQINAPYFTVNHARKRMAGPYGWHCRLKLVTCVHCQRRLLVSAASTRTSHAACRQHAINARLRAARTIPGHATSTAGVARWRAAHPEANAALRARDASRITAERWPLLPPEQQQSFLAKRHEADARDQQTTAKHATQNGARWTEDEDRYVLDTLHLPAREQALHLGRSLWSVRHRRMTLKRQYGAG